MKEIHVGDAVIVDRRRKTDLVWSDGKKRVAMTKEEILELIEYPTTYFHEEGHTVLWEKRFNENLNRIFGEEEE